MSRLWRVPITVDPQGYPRWDLPVDVELDLCGGEGRPSAPQVHGVIEVDAGGRVVDGAVPFQWEAAEQRGDMSANLLERAGGEANRHAGDGAVGLGQLVFMMKGQTEPNRTRRFYALMGEEEPSDVVEVPGLLTGAADARAGWPMVQVKECEAYQGQASCRIDTPSATYFYHMQGGGFASLIDPDGDDWISYHPPRRAGKGPSGEGAAGHIDPLAKGEGSANQFRGIPNTAFPEPSFHPGSRGATTRLTSRGPLKASLITTSLDGLWECVWSIYPTYATCTMLRHARPFWFLYEGTPGGRFSLDTGFVVRSPGIRTSLGEAWEEALPHPAWVYFGDATTRYTLFLVQHEADAHVDCYWPMNDEMTVFGFGRAGKSKPGTHAYIDETPVRFTIGLTAGHGVGDVTPAIYAAYAPLDVRVGRIELVSTR